MNAGTRDGATSTRRRIRRSRSAASGAVVFLSLVAGALILLPFSLRWYNVQALDDAVRHPPVWSPVVSLDRYLVSARTEGVGWNSARLTELAHGAASWMGHDALGRSLFYRLSLGFLVSLGIGFGAAAIALFVGVTWGLVAAFAGGRIDSLMMRIVDVLYGLPYLLTVILLKIALTRPLTLALGERSRAANLVLLFIAIGGVSWLTMARVIRGQVLSLQAQPFVEAARAMGAGPLRILLRHLLPNLIGPIVVYATLVIPQAILQESFLSFLGLGIQQPLASLGQLAADGVEAVNTFVSYWWLLAFPCGILAIVLLTLNFIGDGLRDLLDPRFLSGKIN